MAKHIIDTVTSATVVAKTAGDTWIVTQAGEIATPSIGIDASGGAAGRTIVVNGIVDGMDYGILFGKPNGDGGGEIRIGAGGLVNADDTAIFAYGDGQVIANKGTISGMEGIYTHGKNVEITNDGAIDTSNNGIAIEKGSAKVVNTGTIVAEGGIWAPSALNGGASSVIVINSGSITGSKVGIELVSDGDHQIRNTGTVDGDIFTGDGRDFLKNGDGGLLLGGEIGMGDGIDKLVNDGAIQDEIELGDGNDTFVNRGSVTQQVDLGDGDDVADLRGGTVSGLVVGLTGDDVFIVGNQTCGVFEGAGEGNDTIRTTVSYSLTVGANGEIENLVAIGDKNIDLTGNGLSNHVTGNAGKNVIDGYTGDDVLRGGAAADTFVFKTGYGTDRVMDFENGVDRIDVSAWTGIDSFADIKAILTVDGNDLVLTSGADELVIHDMKKSELNGADFVF